MYSVLQAWPILLTLACQVSADTYYIDSSCTNHKNWKDEIWTETQTLARRTLYRTNLGERDPNQLRALQLLWKVPAVASQNIQKQYTWITGMTKEGGPEPEITADIRIYCDNDPTSQEEVNDDRWQATPDRKDDKNPNSKQPADQKELFDQINWMKMPSATFRGCHTSFQGKLINAWVSSETIEDWDGERPTYNGKVMPANLPENRRTICMCDNLLDNAKYKTLADIGSLPDFMQADPDDPDDDTLITLESASWNSIPVTTMIHELGHAGPIRPILIDANFPESYGWIKCVAMPYASSILNADHFKQYTVVAQLADWKYKISDGDYEGKIGQIEIDTEIIQKRRKARRRWGLAPALGSASEWMEGWRTEVEKRALEQRAESARRQLQVAFRGLVKGEPPLRLFGLNESVALMPDVVLD